MSGWRGAPVSIGVEVECLGVRRRGRGLLRGGFAGEGCCSGGRGRRASRHGEVTLAVGADHGGMLRASVAAAAVVLGGEGGGRRGGRGEAVGEVMATAVGLRGEGGGGRGVEGRPHQRGRRW